MSLPHVQGVQEQLRARCGAAQVADLGPLLGPPVAQGAFGERPAFTGGQGLSGRQPGQGAVEPGPLEHLVAPAVGDPPAPEARQPQARRDAARAFGGMLDRVGQDRVHQRCRQPAIPTLRLRLGPQTRLAVRPVARTQLVEPAAPDPCLAAGLHHRDFAPRHAIDDVLAQACQTVCGSHRTHSSVEVELNGRSVPVAPFLVSEIAELSTFNVGSTG